MRKIQLKISLEDYKSRVPGFIPSFQRFDKIRSVQDVDDRRLVKGKPTTFNEIGVLTHFPNANYGLFPCDVRYNEDGKVYTYADIREAYTFFRKYYALLHSPCCGNVRDYNNAVELYEFESGTLPFTKPYYESLDKTAASYGADLSIGECKFYDDLCQDLFRTYLIPSEFSDGWDTDRLYATEVIDWRTWFHQTKDAIEKGLDDCCIIEKYRKLGGDDMLAWLDDIDISTDMVHFESLDEAGIDIKLSISQKIDEMGEYSPLVEEWEPGTDYTPSSEHVLHNGHGTVVVHNGRTFSVKRYYSGFVYDEEKKKIVWDDDAWEPYETDSRRKPFVGAYAYKNERVFVSPSEYEVPEEMRLTPQNMSDKYSIRRGGFFLVNGQVYESEVSDYIVYKSKSNTKMNGQVVKVSYRGAIPYVDIKGRKYFAHDDGDGYYFNFGYQRCGRVDHEYDCSIVRDGEVVTIGEYSYLVEDGFMSIKNYRYKMFDGIIETERETIYSFGDTLIEVEHSYGNGMSQYFDERTDYGERNPMTVDEHTNGYVIEDDVLTVYHAYTIYYANIIEGVCDSKLSGLEDTVKTFDDYGNLMDGKYHVKESVYPTPREDETLDLYYHIGNVANLTFVDRKDGLNVYGGDLITRIRFYYKDLNGKIIEETIVEEQILDTNKDFSDNRPFIEECESKKSALLENPNILYNINNTMFCEITYQVDSIIRISTEDVGEGVIKYGKYTINGDDFLGVAYTDEFSMNKEAQTYGFAGGDDYTVKCWRLEPMLMRVVLDDFRNVVVQVPQSKFSIDKSRAFNYFDYYSNGEVASPMFKFEHDFGMTLRQNRNVDIYINRGKSQSHDRHLRLMETKSVEAFEQYGNGFWYIINN